MGLLFAATLLIIPLALAVWDLTQLKNTTQLK
jgi:hypothetical protein